MTRQSLSVDLTVPAAGARGVGDQPNRATDRHTTR